ncbi:MAG: hypothetical protein ABFC89_13075 [Methanospirillum sp.]
MKRLTAALNRLLASAIVVVYAPAMDEALPLVAASAESSPRRSG